jgi:hypothetical protein
VTIDAEGVQSVPAVAVDGAGNRTESAATVRIDRTPPAATLTCAPASTPTGYRCVAGGSDAGSGLASVRFRLDGGAWTAPAPDGSFVAASGRVEVQAADVAGLTTVSAPVDLGARNPVVTNARTVAVALTGSKGIAGLLGSLELRVVRDAAGQTLATADLRPLALGAGRYRTTLAIASGSLRAERSRSYTLRTGQATRRLRLALSRVLRPARVELTVRRRTHGHWVVVASARTSVKPPAQAA